MANTTNTTNTTEVERLRAENARLKDELAKAQTVTGAATGPNVPHEPSYGMSEGERQDLELYGKTTSPFTGEVRTADKSDKKTDK